LPMPIWPLSWQPRTPYWQLDNLIRSLLNFSAQYAIPSLRHVRNAVGTQMSSSQVSHRCITSSPKEPIYTLISIPRVHLIRSSYLFPTDSQRWICWVYHNEYPTYLSQRGGSRDTNSGIP
jgi:hypothetical protein